MGRYTVAFALAALGLASTAPHAAADSCMPPKPVNQPADAAELAALPPQAGSPAQGFTFDPPGSAHPRGGKPDTDPTIYAPNIRFPIEQTRAYANSQVYGIGGKLGPEPLTAWTDARNYAYPWQDTFCEDGGRKKRVTPLCPVHDGHQGQDIRPNGPQIDRYLTVAAEAGTIVVACGFSVDLLGDDGRVFVYLHMDMARLKVKKGDRVQRGQPLGYVSNNFGKNHTTRHLHFEIREAVIQGGTVITTEVPPYPSLVDAYQRLLAGTP